MTPETISALVGIVLSLAFGYLPGLRTWYDSLQSEQKAALMGLLIVVIAAGSLAYACKLEAACLTLNWEQAFSVLIAALVANQSVYAIAVRPFRNPPSPPRS